MKLLSPKAGVCIIVALAAVVVGVCSPRAAEMPREGWPFGNRQIVAYHNGLGAWIGLAVPYRSEFLIGNQPSSEVDQGVLFARQANQSWGGADFWLRLPECRIGLWWIVDLAAVAGLLMVVRGNRARKGFRVAGGEAG